MVVKKKNPFAVTFVMYVMDIVKKEKDGGSSVDEPFFDESSVKEWTRLWTAMKNEERLEGLGYALTLLANHWLPELDAKIFGNKWLLSVLLRDLFFSRVSVGGYARFNSG